MTNSNIGSGTKLKFFCQNENFCGNFYSLKCLANAAKTFGHTWEWWNGPPGQRQPILDMWHLHKDVDIFVGTTYGMDEAVLRAVQKWREVNPAFKLVLFGSACGPFIDSLPAEYPIVKWTEDERAMVDRAKPDLIYIHHSPRWAEQTLEGWKADGHKITGIMNAGDLIEYGGGKHDSFLECDVAYVGGRWAFKKSGIDSMILPLCEGKHNLRVKIFGNTHWPVTQYLGSILESRVSSLFVSALVCPSVSEPHSRTHGFDPIERPFKTIISGGFCISDEVETLKADVFGDALPMTNNPTDYIDMVKHYVKNPDERLPIMKKCRDIILQGHTGFHRVNHLFDSIGMPEKKCNVTIKT